MHILLNSFVTLMGHFSVLIIIKIMKDKLIVLTCQLIVSPKTLNEYILSNCIF